MLHYVHADERIRWITWRDMRHSILKALPIHLLAKNIPHTLQDHMNGLPKEFRDLASTRVIFEAMMAENTLDDEPDAPLIKIFNNVDDQPTPNWEFHYSNLMWYGEGVPGPDLSNLMGCDCVGPCDPKSNTCACIQKQRMHTKSLSEGFLYDSKGCLTTNGAPIFECNVLCGCTQDCGNRVSVHQNHGIVLIQLRLTGCSEWPEVLCKYRQDTRKRLG
jgi:[histone H3]-lysine9 N-trimethyltransferase SUV39H